MKKQRFFLGIAAFTGMLILILDGQTALQGAQQGIELCVKTVVPSLFPFFILSGLLTNAFLGVQSGFLRPLGLLCRIPKGAESLLITGFLGGYPVGAQCVAGAWRSGQLDRAQAERMLGFCSNAGPAFLFGIVSVMFPGKINGWVLWLIHILSALLTAAVLPGRSDGTVRISREAHASLSDAMTSSLKVMGSVCGWVIFFRIIIVFLDKWLLWIFSPDIRVALICLIELSNGCCSLNMISSEEFRFVICSVMLALGGLCVTMQTISVTHGLSLHYYIPGKLLQALFSAVLAIAYLHQMGSACILILLFFVVLFLIIQKKSSFPQSVGV